MWRGRAPGLDALRLQPLSSHHTAAPVVSDALARHLHRTSGAAQCSVSHRIQWEGRIGYPPHRRWWEGRIGNAPHRPTYQLQVAHLPPKGGGGQTVGQCVPRRAHLHACCTQGAPSDAGAHEGSMHTQLSPLTPSHTHAHGDTRGAYRHTHGDTRGAHGCTHEKHKLTHRHTLPLPLARAAPAAPCTP